MSCITKDLQKVYYNLRSKGEFVQELYYNREFQIMYSGSTLLFIIIYYIIFIETFSMNITTWYFFCDACT